MERYSPPETARFVPGNKISPKFKRVHEKDFLGFLCLYGTRKSINENENKENKNVDKI